jgi:hypothetical protein
VRALAIQHAFAVVGHRPPSIQRVRLGAGPDGRLNAVYHTTGIRVRELPISLDKLLR